MITLELFILPPQLQIRCFCYWTQTPWFHFYFNQVAFNHGQLIVNISASCNLSTVTGAVYCVRRVRVYCVGVLLLTLCFPDHRPLQHRQRGGEGGEFLAPPTGWLADRRHLRRQWSDGVPGSGGNKGSRVPEHRGSAWLCLLAPTHVVWTCVSVRLRHWCLFVLISR